MFGFLKKKLKEAVGKFTKKAKEEIVEEKVEDKEVIEKAKVEEKKLLAKDKKVTEIPETSEEKEQHEKEAKAPPKKEKPVKKEKKPEPTPKVKPKKEKLLKIEIRKEPEEKKEKPKPVTEPILEKPKEEPEPVPEKKGFLKKIFTKKEEPAPEKEPEPTPEEPTPEPVVEEPPSEDLEEEPATEETPEEVPEKPVEEEPQPKRGLFKKFKESFTKKTLSEEKFEEMFWDLEVVLLENNVALEVIEKIKEDLKQDLTTGKVSRLGIEDMILVSLKNSVEDILSIPGFDLVKKINKANKRPYVITFIGVNGSGKTTTLAKIANLFNEEGLGVVIAASDTFRAAAIDQLKEHADKLGIKMISQGYGADPAAVAYDAIEHAKAKQLDIVMIDTAGRLHSNTNLMAELEKVVRVAKPDLKIFIGESITGNDCIEQAKEFDKVVGIDAVILSKADVDEKGGAALSVSYVTGKPIIYLGVGQAYGDLKKFDKELIIKNLGL
ncbi:signal recognition particle-docking protein FtsY [Candidatus Woesearchaeota archaeon]|nr:signal recognition particle-docking protein FtsY [Candidatus Woesearchaeota archaeon]